MEFLMGGDLMSQLIKKEIFSEAEAKFYCAELISAVEYVHSKNCIHRDIKPDNILIDRNGHIKLSDFGLSRIFDKDIYNLSCNNLNQAESNDNVYYDLDLIKSSSNTKALSALSKLRKKRIVR